MTLSTAVLYGSARRDRQGIRLARFMMHKLAERGHDATLIDTAERSLPMLDLMYKEYEAGTAPPDMQWIADVLDSADGFVVVSAEYNHSVPAALKNLLDHFQGEYLYKPSAIVTYSAGPFGGVRSLVNMRGILAELGSPAIPSSFPVSTVGASMDEDGRAVDTDYDERVVSFLDEYEWYAEALKVARNPDDCPARPPGQQQLCRGGDS